MSKADNLAPTSALPFAARHCDVSYLDRLKYYRHELVEKLENKCSEIDSSFVEYAYSTAGTGDRMSQIGDLLEVASSLFEKAHRGDSTELSPSISFDKAMRILALSRELLECAVLDGDAALVRVCEVVPDSQTTPAKTKASKPTS